MLIKNKKQYELSDIEIIEALVFYINKVDNKEYEARQFQVTILQKGLMVVINER